MKNQNNKEIENKNTEKTNNLWILNKFSNGGWEIDAELTYRANKSTRIYYALNKIVLGYFLERIYLLSDLSCVCLK